MLHMFGVDIGDDRDGRGQTIERAVALVGLDHHPFARACARIRAIGVDDPAIDHGRVEIALVQKRRDHRRGRRLAVGAADRDVRFQAHQLGQHLGAAHDRKTAAARLFQLGISRLDRGGDHHDARLTDILGALALENGRAQFRQTVGDLGGFRIRALNREPLGHQHFGDAGHADPADTDEMDGAEFSGQFGRVH